MQDIEHIEEIFLLKLWKVSSRIIFYYISFVIQIIQSLFFYPFHQMSAISVLFNNIFIIYCFI
jgi:hypothetical protein